MSRKTVSTLSVKLSKVTAGVAFCQTKVWERGSSRKFELAKKLMSTKGGERWMRQTKGKIWLSKCG